ncbi:MAG TPA: PD-(D/E)XK nuclease family protein, partial [bacterium]|nr:PD-(D/E)XK nuclease family protein [bacterium]
GRGRRVLPVTSLGKPPVQSTDAPRGTGGAGFGLLVHRALEIAGRSPERDPENLVREAGGTEAPDAETVERAVALIARVRRDPAVQAVERAPRSWREVPFLLPVDEDFLSGTLDVLVEGSGETLNVVDWKTERVGPGGAESAKERHRPQALAYAWAAHRITGRPVREVRLVFLSEDPVETASFLIDPDLLIEAQALIGRARMGDSAGESDIVGVEAGEAESRRSGDPRGAEA